MFSLPHITSFLCLSWLQLFLAFFFNEPPPHPSDKPTTHRANGRSASFRLTGKQQTLLAEFRALLLPSMYEEQALLRLLPGGTRPWTNTAAGRALWQSDTVQTRWRWAEYLMLLTEGGILEILTEIFVTGLCAERQCLMEESRCQRLQQTHGQQGLWEGEGGEKQKQN